MLILLDKAVVDLPTDEYPDHHTDPMAVHSADPPCPKPRYIIYSIKPKFWSVLRVEGKQGDGRATVSDDVIELARPG